MKTAFVLFWALCFCASFASADDARQVDTWVNDAYALYDAGAYDEADTAASKAVKKAKKVFGFQ